ncbi:MAG: transporter [Longimicrobiales bacterium]|nr:transporter [Longimicrobiales bacterium]
MRSPRRTPSKARRPPIPAFLSAALALLTPIPTAAQALPFHTPTGLTSGFNENAARHFVSILGRSGLVRNGTSIDDPMDREISAIAVVTGAVVGSFTPLWTWEVVLPWVRKEMDFTAPGGGRAHVSTSGVGDAFLQSKWIFYREDRPGATTRVGIQGRLKVPLGSTDARLPSGEEAPRPLQVGTGSWDFEPTLLFTATTPGRWGFHGNAGWRFNGSDDGFEAGDLFLYNLAVGARLFPDVYQSMRDQTWVAYLELNGEVSRRDEVDGVRNPDSGGHLLFLSPALQWIPTPSLLFEVSVQLPVLQELDGTQLEYDTRVQIGTRYRFSILR